MNNSKNKLNSKKNWFSKPMSNAHDDETNENMLIRKWCRQMLQITKRNHVTWLKRLMRRSLVCL